MNELTQFYGPNAGYVLELYDRYRHDPSSVDAETRALFARWTPSDAPVTPDGARVDAAVAATDRVAAGGALGPVDVERVVRLTALVRSIRARGHTAAQLDPLGSPPPGDPDLDAASRGVVPADLAQLPASVVDGPVVTDARNAGEAIERLRGIYCGTTGYDYGHIQVAEERAWLRDAVESGRFMGPLSAQAKRDLLDRLTQVEAFEHFLQRKYPTQKRFSIEGTDMLVPMLDAIVHAAGLAGTHEVVMGMAHRGRLNVLAHVLGKPYAKIFAEFQQGVRGAGAAPSEHFVHYGWTGDVKYHLGARRTIHESETVDVQVTLAPNPSHLEFVNPVIQGMARALQDRRTKPGYPDQDTGAALAILIHGDSAFPGEGIVAEALNLSRLAGYRVGGTIHIIANNQLGFTTLPRDARSTLYASDPAKGFEIPIVHVNADDPEACIAAVELAFAYRERFEKDFLIDLVGYRRYGHNENDEPAYTQPLMYEAVRAHPSVRALWAQRLQREGLVSVAEADATLEAAIAGLNDVQPERTVPIPDELSRGEGAGALPRTAVPAETLEALNEALLARPRGFAANAKLESQLSSRREALGPDGPIFWAHAESLALATLLADGTPIRMVGQDTERGTFSQRHLVLHDAATGASFIPLHAMPQARASFALYNSPLSESGALGFEYGYNVIARETLVMWEAQYGDFANAGQVIIDQFISSARAKWRELPWLVLLLPHGYEGQGPEHSSGRLERFLQLAGGDNLRVANCTTAAQYFHLLRRQVALRESDPRPLVLMTPKSLLRDRLAASRLEDLTQGAFQPVMDDAEAGARSSAITRVVFCSGKVYYDLLRDGAREASDRVAIVRIEQLFPFPVEEIRAILDRYPNMQEVVWLQEEPRNMGAWSYIAPRLRELAGRAGDPVYIGRSDRGSPAEGSPLVHRAEQERIAAAAFANVPERPTIAQGVK